MISTVLTHRAEAPPNAKPTEAFGASHVFPSPPATTTALQRLHSSPRSIAARETRGGAGIEGLRGVAWGSQVSNGSLHGRPTRTKTPGPAFPNIGLKAAAGSTRCSGVGVGERGSHGRIGVAYQSNFV
jgi:hypothetical protein